MNASINKRWSILDQLGENQETGRKKWDEIVDFDSAKTEKINCRAGNQLGDQVGDQLGDWVTIVDLNQDNKRPSPIIKSLKP